MFRWFENLVDPFGDGYPKDTPPQRLAPFLLLYLRPFSKVIAATLVFTAIVAVIEIGLIYYSGRLVDLLGGTTPADFIRDHGVELLAVALFLLFLRPVLQSVDMAFLNQSIMPNLGTLVRWRAHRHVLRQSVGWFENDFAGRIANRIMQTAPAVGAAVFQIFDAVSFSIIYMIGALFMLAQMDLRLAIPLLIWLALYLALMAWIIPRIGERSKIASDARSAITGRIVDAYTNIQSVKLFAHHREEEAYAREAIEHSRRTFQSEMRLYTLMDFGLTLVNGILIVGVIGLAILFWAQGTTSVGGVAAASALVLRLNAMTGWIMWALSSLFQELGVVAEGMETIAQPIDMTDRVGAKALKVSKGEIRIDRVSHHYGKDAGGLDRVELTVRGGERVGLVGRSGAGKSTLVNLILRFRDPEDGRIAIDGQDVGRVTQASLRGAIGMVTQDTSLMHRSVRDNIRYGRPAAPEAEVIAAARKAEAHEFILGLEDADGRKGYDAHVGERGVKLSGGQRQRIALARVILKDAPILILDEATSALDSEIEAAIQDTLDAMMAGKTVIAIAHRLSTIARMDRIIVLDEGRIAEDGTHAELLARGGLYAGFWARQSGGFIGLEDEAAE